MNVREVAIYERDNGWELEGLRGGTLAAHAATGIEALALIKARDLHETMATGRDVATVVTWHPFTGVGRAVVMAITSEGGKR